METAALTAPKPPECGPTGDIWSQEGWLVRVNWQPLRQALVPQTFFELIQPLLTERHSPISTSTGRGNQGVYLAGLSETLGLLLLKLIEDHADPALGVHLVVLAEEGEVTASLLDDMQRLREVVSSTERDAPTKARLGQGLFRHRVAEREPACRVTGLARQEFLVASHIKPWRECDNSERLDGANGLLLSPPCGQAVRPPLDQLRCRWAAAVRARRGPRGVALLGNRGGEPDPSVQPGGLPGRKR